MMASIWLAGQPLVHALGWTLLHFCWQGMVVGVVLWGVLGVLGGRSSRSSRVRYGVACLALAAMVVLPVATFVRLVAEARHSVGTVVAVRIELPVVEMGGGVEAIPTASWKEYISGVLDEAAPWVPAVWLVGVLLFLGRLNFGLMVARRMKSAGTEAATLELQRVFEELKARLGVGRAVRLVNSARVQVPTVIGWLRPVVLLPMGCFMGLSALQVEALLAHELAHIRRHDYLVSVVQSVVEALLFYHPAVWWVSRQVRRERECCCDDLAVGVGGDPLAYAKALSWLEEYRAAMPEIALGANGGVLTMRIRRLLGYKEGSAGSQAAALAVLLVLAASGGLGISTTARAQLEAVVRKAPVVLAGKAGASLGNAKLTPAKVADATSGGVQPAVLPRDGWDQDDREHSKAVQAAEDYRLLLQQFPDSPHAPEAAQRLREVMERLAPAALPPLYMKWLNQDVVWIIGPEERDAFLHLNNDQERDKFIEQFWERRNPPGAPENQYRADYYARIAYTNEHYGANNVAGWRTDRGRIYIVYGRPESVESHPTGDATGANLSGRMTSPFPFEVWHYGHVEGVGDNITLVFVDTCECGLYNYTIDRPGLGGPAPAIFPPAGAVRVDSEIMKANLILNPAPIYPDIAKAAHVQGR